MRRPTWSRLGAVLYLGQASDVLGDLPPVSADCIITTVLPLSAITDLRRVLVPTGTIWLYLPLGVSRHVAMPPLLEGWQVRRRISLHSGDEAMILVLSDALHRAERRGCRLRQAPRRRGMPRREAACRAVRRRRHEMWREPCEVRPPIYDPIPLAVARRCVAAGSPLGGTVLDLRARGGRVGVAAAQLGRRYVGIEPRPEYFAIARRRLQILEAQGD